MDTGGKHINQLNEGPEIKLHSGEGLIGGTIIPHIKRIFSNNGKVRYSQNKSTRQTEA